jgi:hypothetical protein
VVDEIVERFTHHRRAAALDLRGNPLMKLAQKYCEFAEPSKARFTMGRVLGPAPWINAI